MEVILALVEWLKKMMNAGIEDMNPSCLHSALLWVYVAGMQTPSYEELKQV